MSNDMAIEIELGRESRSVCGCCGKTSWAMRGFALEGDRIVAAYIAGYTERHEPQEATILIGMGDWSEGARSSDRRAVAMKVRSIDGRLQVMVVGPEGLPWTDVQVFGAVQSRQSALASADIKEYFHVVDHVLANDARFTRYFDQSANG